MKIANNKTKIIAEIGVNHCGKISIAKKLIDVAINSGADAVKFQTYITENFVTKKTNKAEYQLSKKNKNETHFEMLKNLEFNEKDFYVLKKYCDKKKIEFISTPYDLKSVDILEKLKVKTYKVASADINDFLLHKKLSKLNKLVIISTGMANINDIKKAIHLYSKKNVELLHCVSSYPCEENILNLNNILLLQEKFGLKVGFSDHTKGYEAALIAYGLGARTFEKHITLSNNMYGPDHKASLNPKDFKNYVNKIKKAEIILGRKRKILLPEEKEMKKISSKSVTLKNDMKKNEILTYKNIIMKRPGLGISGFEIKKIIGKKVRKNIKKETQISLKDFFIL